MTFKAHTSVISVVDSTNKRNVSQMSFFQLVFTDFFGMDEMAVGHEHDALI